MPRGVGEDVALADRKHIAGKNTVSDTDSDHGSYVAAVAPSHAPVEDPPAASFMSLFRFHSPFEIIANCLALIAASAAGAAQPLMTLLFANLVNKFVVFQRMMYLVDAGEIDQSAFQAAAADFKKAAADDALYLVIMGIGLLVCTFIYMYIWVYTAEVNAKRIRERYLQAVLRQEIAFFDNVGAGEVATRIQTDTHLVQRAISEKVPLVVSYLGAFFCGFILAYIRQWRLALAMTSVIPVLVISGTFMNIAISKYTRMSLKHSADAGSVAEEVISSIRTVKAFGTQAILGGLYDSHIAKSGAAEANIGIWLGGTMSLAFFSIYSSYGLAFYYGTTLIQQGHADAGVVINVFMAILTGSLSLAMIGPEQEAITEGCGAAPKLFATIDRVPYIDSADPSGKKLHDVDGEIKLEAVQFSYPSRPTLSVVKDLSLTFRAGRTAAMVGASGSGKSTVVSLIERFYDPTAGRVTLDGHDLKTLNVKWLRSQIGLVSQEPVLFSGTVFDNVAHGLVNTRFELADPETRLALVKEACVKANADDFVTKLPQGYHTAVGERGLLLSGGQKQRIAIARAIVSDPRILLLDEATASLDGVSEGIVQNALDKAAVGRTTIIVAHRLATVRDADVIFVMGDGQLLEQGKHDELISNNGPYAQLVLAQKLRGITGEGEIPKDTKDGASRDTYLNQEVIPFGRSSTIEQSLDDRSINKRSTDAPDISFFSLFRRMLSINNSQWRVYCVGALFAVLNGCVYPSLGVVYAKGISGFSETDDALRTAGNHSALYFFIIAIGTMFACGPQHGALSISAAHLSARIKTLSFRALLRQDVEYFDEEEHGTGALTANLSSNSQKINGLFGITLGVFIQSIVTVIGGSILGLVFIWKVGLVAVACNPLVLSAGYFRLKVVGLKDKRNQKAHEKSAQLACEVTGAVRTVAALTREDDCLAQYSRSLEGPLRESNRSAIWSNLLFALSQAMSFFVIALVFWYGAILVANREFGTFAFFVGLLSTTFSCVHLAYILAGVPDASSALSAGSRVLHLLDSVPDIDSEATQGKHFDMKKARGQIKFSNVHFRYPTRPGVRVLRGLDFSVEPGMYVALVGASGSGKSTTVQLLERFYDPLAGEITLDGVKINEYNVQSYRQQIALVSQEPTLYAGTLRFNILLGAAKPTSEVTQDELEEACRNANILDFIHSLPDGFDTQVGGKGSQLSGGQKQRIAIARALLRNPRVLLLDEATSALDSDSERTVQAALDQAAKGRTTIAIAHRLSTIQNADKIFFIKEGRVSESGTHDELVSYKGDYYAYVQLQAMSKGG
ncbi:P-loop containing nucleoside triphosphate hydrolase protein [Cylindrobasidium torrendii FP15055 ss-10]|uniref:p-loop containing nucleoside triphosphate hydrolase protein n=1 Tax=Cylindrobasidium torrendii FP15055 ss-10 TaxID=1314674 RepID=A0A0D7AXZ5_9AGAR|nr:P-loop containing nucleoside triphosphate hydrolase protein [Cylindrobasidium torrendii FP15055 ss-10]